jgi:hypothetical protein
VREEVVTDEEGEDEEIVDDGLQIESEGEHLLQGGARAEIAPRSRRGTWSRGRARERPRRGGQHRAGRGTDHRAELEVQVAAQ